MGIDLDKIVNLKGVPIDHEHYCPICGRLVPKFEFDWVNSKGELEHHMVQPICKCEAEADQREWDRINGRRRRDDFEAKYSSLNEKQNHYTQCSFENFTVNDQNKDAELAARRFAVAFPQTKNLYIHGLPGNGKSHLAAAIARRVKGDEQLIVIYITFAEVLAKLKNSFDSRDGDSEGRIMGALTTCDLLILDDVGVEKPSEYACEVMYRIVDQRMRTEMPIVFTSNYSPQSLRARYKTVIGDMEAGRIIDRIIDGARVVENLDENHRKALE